jgi:WD40 repeat protein
MLFLADGTLAVGDHSGQISFWDPAAGSETGRLDAHGGKRVAGLALSADGRTLASAGDDYAVRLWSVPSRRELFTIHQAKSRVHWLQFDPGGTLSFRSTGGSQVRPGGKLRPGDHSDKLWTFPAASASASR